MTLQDRLPAVLVVQAFAAPPAGAGRPPSGGAHALPLSVREIRQLFDSMDPAPFRERDLDDKAAQYIIDSAREAPANVPLCLEVHLGEDAVTPETASMLHAAIDEYFGRRAAATRRQLRSLLRTGRISLVIGLAFLGGAFALADFLSGLIGSEGHNAFITESLVIGGWVALWRPLEIFLYDWWPIRAEARLFERLSTMDVRVFSAADGAAVDGQAT
jgi:hypothetical protein